MMGWVGLVFSARTAAMRDMALLRNDLSENQLAGCSVRTRCALLKRAEVAFVAARRRANACGFGGSIAAGTCPISRRGLDLGIRRFLLPLLDANLLRRLWFLRIPSFHARGVEGVYA